MASMTRDLTELSVAVRRLRRSIDEKLGARRMLETRYEELKAEVLELTESVIAHERATSLLNSIGEEKQFAAQEAIEQLVTRGLQTIFDDTLSFHIIQDVKARRAEVSFVVRSTLENGRVVDTDVMDARGGGLAATVGFLLRLVVMLLRTDSKTDNFMVLDETFAHVSAEYIEGLRDFIRTIVDKTGVQILMVTHQPEFALAADKVYRLSASNGKSSIKEVG